MNRPLALLIVLCSIGAITLVVAGSPGNQAGRAQVPIGVVINEVAWSGTTHSDDDEWIELYNSAGAPVDLDGWTLEAVDGSPSIDLHGIIPAQGFFLLERGEDDTISDDLADLIYTGVLQNPGDGLKLLDDSSTIIDTANGDGGPWPGGTVSPRYSMERIDPTAPGDDANWGTNDGLTRNGLDAGNNPINGTPGAPNSAWNLPGAILRLDKHGPETVLPGARITYAIVLSNAGLQPAQTVRLTDALPAQVTFLTHTAPFTFHQPSAGTLVWELGTVPTTTSSNPITFSLTAQVAPAASGILVNVVTATSKSHPLGSYDTAVTTVNGGPGLHAVLIEALYYDGYAYGDEDEAFRLLNTSAQAVDIGGWSVTDQAGSGGAVFPPGTSLAPGQALWCTRKATAPEPETAFEQHFGFKADFETDETDPVVPELGGSWPTFANGGGACLLRDASGRTVDALVYAGGVTTVPGWQGRSVEPWSPNNYFGAEGQILYRKRDQITGLPLADTDTAADWAQDPSDQVYGRKARYPGWDLDRFFWSARLTDTAVLTVAVGPDHLLETIVAQIERAQHSIQIEGYTLESADITQALIDRRAAGVSVTILLEGGPAGGIEPAQRWNCGQIHAAGGQVYFMSHDAIPARYRYQHAKVILIDDRLVLIGSENLNPTSMPADDKSDGTSGRRGVYLITSAPGIVRHIQDLLAVDIDPLHHGDLVTCEDTPDLCTGSPPFVEPNWTSYTVAFPQPLTLNGEFAFEIVQSPDNSLRTVDGLLGLVGRAGAGDTILAEQLYEHLHWGPSDGTPETDPNLRLQAYLDAARRGATVRILLNSFTFGDYQNENVDTVAYLRSIARAEGLDLQVRMGNPTGLGVHNKMVLAQINGRGYIHVGSINGSEVSSKVSREVALQVQSDAAYDYLRQVFDHDWRNSPLFTYLPFLVRNHQWHPPADHLLLGELYYAESKDQEWVEIVNPTSASVNLSGYKLGDAERPDIYEGMYQFPPGATIGPGQVLVVASSARVFQQSHGRHPDYEFYATDSGVPDLIPTPSWGSGEWELRNAGDEVLLLDALYQPVDVIVYGDDSYPGHVSHPGVSLYAHSLERYPPFLDTNDCSLDFRDWPFPNPGQLLGTPDQNGQKDQGRIIGQ